MCGAVCVAEIKCRPKRAPVGVAAWVEVPCKVITWQSLTEHSQSNCNVHRDYYYLASH